MISTLCDSCTCNIRKICARYYQNEDLLKDEDLTVKTCIDYSATSVIKWIGLFDYYGSFPSIPECNEKNGYKQFVELINKNEPGDKVQPKFKLEWFDTFVDCITNM